MRRGSSVGRWGCEKQGYQIPQILPLGYTRTGRLAVIFEETGRVLASVAFDMTDIDTRRRLERKKKVVEDKVFRNARIYCSPLSHSKVSSRLARNLIKINVADSKARIFGLQVKSLRSVIKLDTTHESVRGGHLVGV